jgi:hypothetical protein
MEINKILIHEDWKSYVTRFDADIALLFFKSAVVLTDVIRTVCLPRSWQANDLLEGQVVGYGASERTDFKFAEDTPRKAMLKKPPTNELCFLENSELTQIASNRTFCAGGEGSGPCSGDSVSLNYLLLKGFQISLVTFRAAVFTFKETQFGIFRGLSLHQCSTTTVTAM